MRPVVRVMTKPVYDAELQAARAHGADDMAALESVGFI